MASEPHGVRTYPVWVGNLKETVKDRDLTRVFSKVGAVANCRVMVDEHGTSKKFGYVNFFNEAEAEKAAKMMAGFHIQGAAIKTKGPTMLRLQGHFSPPRDSSPPVDYRPLTDCSFYIQGKECKKGEGCPYRHNIKAKANRKVCSQWVEKSCKNLYCPFRHPGSKEASKTAALPLHQRLAQKTRALKCSCRNVFCPFRRPLGRKPKSLLVPPPSHVLTQESEQLMKCGGRCGDASCRALFVSSEDLSKHIQMSRLPQCRYCRAIFLSAVEFRDHKKTCRARISSESTDKSSYSSESADLEVLSETDSEISEKEALGGNLHVGLGFPHVASGLDFMHKSASANVLASPKKRKGERRSSEGSSDHKKQNSKKSPKKRSRRNLASGRTKSSMNSEEYTAVVGPFSPPLDPYSYDIGYSDEEEDDDDDIIEYTPYEMARLLSLNEQDMYESEGEDEEPEDEELPFCSEATALTPDQTVKQEQKTVPKKRKKSERDEIKVQGGHEHQDVRSPQRVRLEPVGIFWDIENCSVPVDKSAFALAAKMRRVFYEGKREAEFMCVCDITKEKKEVIDALQKAQVTLVHVNAIAKNAADDKLRQSLRRFAHTYPAPSTVVLISGDVNFSPELNDLRHIHNITIVLVHNPQASEALKMFAHTLINYEEFLKDIEAPSEQMRSNLSRVVIISGLPADVSVPRLSSRLDQISDNCGGKVLRVDPMTGTAKVLFRTQEWATKALKRMNGENVFGANITTRLEPTPTHQQQQHQSQTMKQLSGPALARTFPPKTKKQPVTFPSQSPPPQAYRPHPPRPNVPLPQSHPRPGFHGPRQMMPLHPAGLPLNAPRGFPPQCPQPFVPPASPQRPPYPYSPLYQHQLPSPQQQLPKGPIPRPEGKILIFKVPPIEAAHLEAQVVSMRLEACVKAEHMVLWHNFFEVQILLQVDFLNTAIVRKEEMIRTLYEKGELRPQVANKFIEQCAKSISDVVQRLRLSWEVTTCGWSSDEEEERVIRSRVIALLKMFVPQHWTKWERFKKKYSEFYSAAISEMAVHNACKGAVQILGNTEASKDQVIVFYELSPLVKIVNNHQLHQQLQKTFVKLLSSQPDKKIRLLDFVRVFSESNLGQLPVSSSGKLLQEVITGTPNVTLVGAKPSTIHVTLNPQGSGSKPAVPNSPFNLAGISAAFRKLLINFPNSQIPFNRFQQEYQTFYHHSFRVSDYLLGENLGVRDLIEFCDGITIKDVRSPNGKMEPVVCLTSGPGTQPTQPVTAYKPPARDISELTHSFQNLLKNSPRNQLPLSQFQQVYQTFFHKSFRVSDYIPGTSIGLKELLQFCEGITLKDVPSEGGKTETLVCLQSELLPRSQRSSSSTSSDTSSNVPTGTAGTAPQIPPELIQVFKQDCIDVLRTVPDGKLKLLRFPEMYTKIKGRPFTLAKFKAKKLIHLLQAISDVVQVTGDNQEKVIHLTVVPDTLEDCEVRIAEMLYSLPHHTVYLDRFNNEYEKKFGIKLSNFYGHSKLVKLLERIPNTVEIKGSGPTRTICLQPLKLFAMEMVFLLSSCPPGLPINKVVPQYKETFGRDFEVARYGYPKLIRALEAIPDTIEIRGKGPTRVIFLKAGLKTGTSIKQPVSQQSSLPPPHLFADEITALLMSIASNKMPISTLTGLYNTAFRSTSGQPQVSAEQLQEAMRKLTNVKLTGAGPGQCVHLVQPADTSPENNKPKTKTVEPDTKASPETLPPPTTLNQATTAKRDIHPVVGNPPYDSTSAKLPIQPAVVQPTTTSALQPSVVAETEAKRLCSESHRLLMMHPEHAMTLTELLDYFKSSEDPANPTADQLYHALVKHNKKAGGSGKNPPKIFQVSYIPSSIGDSMIQLNQSDCLVKLSHDLLYLFIYHPTVDFTMSLSELESVYAECYGHKLIPAVYAEKGVPQLLVRKQINKAINFDHVNSLCVVTENSRKALLASLLAELLFLRGEDCSTVEMLPSIYQQHFGVPLHFECFAVENVDALLSLSEIINAIRIVDEVVLQPKPVLTTSALFGEQMRKILTLYNGRILLDQLKAVYSAEFGIRTDINVDNLVDKMLIRLAPQVVNLSGYKWMVWAPSGRPYPKRGNSNREPSAVNTNANNDVPEPVTQEKINGQITSHIEVPSELRKGETEHTAANSEHSILPVENNGASEFVNDPHKITEPSVSVNEDTEVSHNGRDSPIVSLEVSVHPLYMEFGAPQVSVADIPPSAQVSSSKDTLNDTPSVSMQSVLHSNNDEDKTVPQHSTVVSFDAKYSDAMDPSPYGFLERELDPELITEIATDAPVNEDEDRDDSTLDILSGVPFTDAAIELLLRFAQPLTDDFDKDFHNSDPDTSEQQEKEVSVPNEPIDYLASGMNPDEVLEEMQKVKQHSGGVLTTEQMDPFLTYFGELSSRELDRLEALEKKAKPKKETQKKKRVMAARFPGQSPATPPPDPYIEHHQQQMEFLKDKLPVAPDLDNLSDSDSDGSCPHPIAREESIRLLLERGLPDIPISQEDFFLPANSSKREQSEQLYPSSAGKKEEDIPKGQVTESNIPQPLLDPSEAIQDSNILFPDPPLFDEDEHVPELNDHLLDWSDFSQAVNGELERAKRPSASDNS